MTSLAKRKTRLVFETSTVFKRRALVVECQAFQVGLRPKGTRVSYWVDWDSVFWLAAKKSADQVLGQRRGKR
jgi:hypothetical protein